ncbi:inositol 2-dehydrogenase [Lactobacillus sp. W8089]|nr:inositol 2-dehydrogenase [Lactobacillus sp. W8086]MBI0109343.1 inositol 2-dehydrogenase [Lactobacillus sp. W8085]MBI0112272.1 inositol 2-dehydrogenase [Lactobacillus sp. W8088]MBI0116275.1 inositol 2-dehydrogenase [Lactobacillus sp. W8087]MBI0119713.1 inositol 2-dehydrogenase [Lactobacillus sp. W8089]MBI0131678.1 inositol 2-dehydrogenase [Lactobacillus sp. W8090]
MPTNTETVTIAIIGMNRIGKVHYQNLRGMPNVRVKYICDVVAEQSWADLYPDVDKIVTDYHEALEDPDVQAILICVPTDLHPKITMEAARAGKDIFCEKPVGFDDDQIMQAYHTVQETGVKFATGFNRRFDKNFRRIVERRENGELGDEQILKITSRDPEPPSLDYINHSGGIFMDMTIHDFDMARYITGQEVDSVYVAGGVMVDPQIGKAGDLDTVLTTLVFKNGMLGSIDNSRKAVYGYDQRIELFGSQGMAQADNVTDTTTTYSGAQSVESDKPMFFFLERYLDAYRREIESFLDAVRGKHEVECTFADGIKAIRLAQAAKESALTKKAVKVKDI